MFNTNARKIPNVFRKEHLIKLFDTIDNPKLMVAFLTTFLCGLRILEICNLKVEDIDLDNRIITIINSKNPKRTKDGYGKDRKVPIPKNLSDILQLWIQYLDGDEEYLIPFALKTIKGRKYSHQYLRIQYDKYLKKAGLKIPSFKTKDNRQKYRYNYHTLRHSYGTLLEDKGIPLNIAAQLLGHSSMQTTQIYTHTSVEKKRQAIDKVFNDSFKESVDREMNKEPIITEIIDPKEILKLRLAKGEIDLVTYRRLNIELEGIQITNENKVKLIKTKR